MNKYKALFMMSLQSELAYKVNFLMWRLRNIISLIVVFYLWDNVFKSPEKVIFGYDRTKILTYIFGVFIVKAIILTSKSTEVSGEIARGEISNYLLKPINYFKYWFTKDLSVKTLNLSFAIIEFSVLFLLLKPDLYFQTDALYLISFLLSVLAACSIYFLISFIVSSIPFWAPELGWGSHFLITVVLIDFLSGALFPIDILPEVLQKILLLTPFPYMLYFPVQSYLGKLPLGTIAAGLLISLIWVIVLSQLLKYVWKKGLMVYEAYGR